MYSFLRKSWSIFFEKSHLPIFWFDRSLFWMQVFCRFILRFESCLCGYSNRVQPKDRNCNYKSWKIKQNSSWLYATKILPSNRLFLAFLIGFSKLLSDQLTRNLEVLDYFISEVFKLFVFLFVRLHWVHLVNFKRVVL